MKKFLEWLNKNYIWYIVLPILLISVFLIINIPNDVTIFKLDFLTIEIIEYIFNFLFVIILLTFILIGIYKVIYEKNKLSSIILIITDLIISFFIALLVNYLIEINKDLNEEYTAYNENDLSFNLNYFLNFKGLNDDNFSLIDVDGDLNKGIVYMLNDKNNSSIKEFESFNNYCHQFNRIYCYVVYDEKLYTINSIKFSKYKIKDNEFIPEQKVIINKKPLDYKYVLNDIVLDENIKKNEEIIQLDETIVNNLYNPYTDKKINNITIYEGISNNRYLYLESIDNDTLIYLNEKLKPYMNEYYDLKVKIFVKKDFSYEYVGTLKNKE